MFYPHGFGKYQQTSTYSSVKEHIVHYIQKSYEYSADVAESLRDGKKVDLKAVAPTRQVSMESDTAKRQLEQTGFDIVF